MNLHGATQLTKPYNAGLMNPAMGDQPFIGSFSNNIAQSYMGGTSNFNSEVHNTFNSVRQKPDYSPMRPIQEHVPRRELNKGGRGQQANSSKGAV